MEYGKVTKKDVTLTFPEGTEVTDAINGISCTTDANGNSIESTIEALYGLAPSQVKMPGQKPNRTWNYALIVLGLLMMGTGVYLYFDKRRRNA
jgi:LPXTG-motif cell wall-anchored protein